MVKTETSVERTQKNGEYFLKQWTRKDWHRLCESVGRTFCCVAKTGGHPLTHGLELTRCKLPCWLSADTLNMFSFFDPTGVSCGYIGVSICLVACLFDLSMPRQPRFQVTVSSERQTCTREKSNDVDQKTKRGSPPNGEHQIQNCFH